MTDEWRIGEDLEGRGHDLIEVLSLNSTVRTEENHGISHDNRRNSRESNRSLLESKSRTVPLY
jgi:hypothetical protein